MGADPASGAEQGGLGDLVWGRRRRGLRRGGEGREGKRRRFSAREGLALALALALPPSLSALFKGGRSGEWASLVVVASACLPGTAGGSFEWPLRPPATLLSLTHTLARW